MSAVLEQENVLISESEDDVRQYLQEGRRVMFTGTPCQVAGLNSFLGKGYDNLLTVDVACHGVPSPGLWEKYVQALGQKYGSPIKGVVFRDKSTGWRHYSLTVSAADDRHSVPHRKDPYMMLFLQDMTLRPSCYSCPAKCGKSHSDVTLADLWNVSEVAPHLNDDKGASLVLVNTSNGMDVLASVSEELTEVDFAEAFKRNAGFSENVDVPERRDEFFAGIHSTDDIIKYMSGFVVHKSLFTQCYERVHTVLSKIKRRILK